MTLGYDIGPRMTISSVARISEQRPQEHARHLPAFSARRPRRRCAANLNAQQMRWLLDYTAQQSSGIGAWNRDTEHIEKAFVFAGMTRATE